VTNCTKIYFKKELNQKIDKTIVKNKEEEDLRVKLISFNVAIKKKFIQPKN